MTDLEARPSPRPIAVERSHSEKPTSRRRRRPAAASRVLVTGLSVAATLGLATAMSSPEVPETAPAAVSVPDSAIAVPNAVAFAATDQQAVTTSHAS